MLHFVAGSRNTKLKEGSLQESEDCFAHSRDDLKQQMPIVFVNEVTFVNGQGQWKIESGDGCEVNDVL